MPRKKIPKFKTESEERKFWLTHDSSEYVDWSKAKKAYFPNLQPSKRLISIRLPEMLLNEIKILANKRDIPYQSYIKNLLSEKIQEERLKIDLSNVNLINSFSALSRKHPVENQQEEDPPSSL